MNNKDENIGGLKTDEIGEYVIVFTVEGAKKNYWRKWNDKPETPEEIHKKMLLISK